MKRSEKETVRRLIWADRCNRIRVVLDSFRRRGATSVKSAEVAKLIEIPESAVRKIGLTMADRIQIDGAKVKYSAALFLLYPPDA